MKKIHQDNFFVIIKTFANFDTIIKDQCIYNHIAKMLSWNIRNDIISSLVESADDCMKEHISESRY